MTVDRPPITDPASLATAINEEAAEVQLREAIVESVMALRREEAGDLGDPVEVTGAGDIAQEYAEAILAAPDVRGLLADRAALHRVQALADELDQGSTVGLIRSSVVDRIRAAVRGER